MGQFIDVSIILVNWNTKDLLKECIDSIISETTKISYEIIVVDNNSSDGSAEMLENGYRNIVTVIRNKENKGFAAANNQAMKVAKGRYLLLLNSDTRVLDGAIDKSFEYISSHNGVGLIGCKLINSDGTLQYSCYNFNSIFRAFLYKTRLISKLKNKEKYKYEGLITSADYNSSMDVDYVCGAYMMFSREAFERIGYLDESFFMYAEEADYCARLKESGYKVVYFSGASIIHHGGGSSRKISRITENRRIISRLLFIKKHKGTFYFHIYRLFSAFSVMVNIIKITLTHKDGKDDDISKLQAIIKLKYQ